MKPAPFHGLRKRKDGAWSQGKCLGNPRIEGGRWAWGEGFSPHSSHTALAGDTFIILNLVIEKMLEAPKLHLGKKKGQKYPKWKAISSQCHQSLLVPGQDLVHTGFLVGEVPQIEDCLQEEKWVKGYGWEKELEGPG